jgi:ElaA protein
MYIEWRLIKFPDLTPYELYDALRLRSEVFVVEQNCVFLDQDSMDEHCYHLSGYNNEQLVAYSRIVPPGIIYKESSIGRVVTSLLMRKTGIGKELMHRAIKAIYDIYGNSPIKIGAQLYLKSFYESFGFMQASDVYLEDGIKHIYMQKASS